MKTGPGRGYHVFLDHQAAKVIGPASQGQLADRQALRNPTRLEIGEIIEIQATDGERFEILERAYFWQPG